MEIYKITNLKNNKIYIGKDTEADKKYFGSGKLIKAAIQKYGIENFKKEILEVCQNNKELCIREIYWISHFNSTDKNIGYNISKGGDGGDTISNNPNKKEILEKLSKARKGKKYEDFLSEEKVKEYKRKLGIAASKRMKGKSLEELHGKEKAMEIKNKLSIANKKRYSNIPKKEKIKKSEIQIENERIEKLQKKYSILNEFDLYERFKHFKHLNKLDYFKRIVGDEIYNTLLKKSELPFKHKSESIFKLKQTKLEKFLKEKDLLYNYLLENPDKDATDFYDNISRDSALNKRNTFLKGDFSKYLTKEENKVIRRLNKKKMVLPLESRLSMTEKIGKKVIINDVEYICVSEASRILNIDRGTVRYRLKSEKYENYKYK